MVLVTAMVIVPFGFGRPAASKLKFAASVTPLGAVTVRAAPLTTDY